MHDKFALLKKIQCYEDKPTQGYFILKEREVVEEPNIIKWGIWFEKGSRRVAQTTVKIPHRLWYLRWWSSRRLWVSTVFLGVNHGMGGKLELFETMVLEKGNDVYCRRCSTYDEAEEQHDFIVECLYELVES